jgi:hypothetical protein
MMTVGKLFMALLVSSASTYAPFARAQAADSPASDSLKPQSAAVTTLPRVIELRFQGDQAKPKGLGPWPMILTIGKQNGLAIEDASVALKIARTDDGCRFQAIPMRGKIGENGDLQLADTVDPTKDNLTCRLSLNVSTRTWKGRYDLGPGRPGDLTPRP